MSILPRNLASNPASRLNLSISTFHAVPISKFPNVCRISRSNSSISQTLICRRCRDPVCTNSSSSHRWEIRVSESKSLADENQVREGFNFDSFLSFSEMAVLVSSLVVSVACLINWAFLKQKNLRLVALGDKVLLWLLTGAVVLSTAIRRRQWRRVSRVPGSSSEAAGNANLIDRIEQLEENLRSATAIIRFLSKKLEKLGIRFRVTRRNLKDPIQEVELQKVGISQGLSSASLESGVSSATTSLSFETGTAALTRKNSEATRALESQEDRLEKELAEVQNVLLAMQDQQEKQLELIMAVAKNGKLFETKRET